MTGHGDVRKKIVPVIKPPAGPSATRLGRRRLSFRCSNGSRRRKKAARSCCSRRTIRARSPARFDGVALIAVDFPRIGDGRGYSHAVLLRERLGYRGPLRAVGAVTADQVYALTRVGFTSFGLRADQDAETASPRSKTFSRAVPKHDRTRRRPRAIATHANFHARVRAVGAASDSDRRAP